MRNAQKRVRERFSIGALEPRFLLGGGFPYELVLPEGYATDAIRQIVPLGNPGAIAADYRLIARYERAFAEQIIASGTLAPDSRGTITVSDPTSPSATVVRKDEPYALVLESTRPLVASLEHSDFGSVVSVPFTDAQSTVWSFAEVRREPGAARDFVLVYNPGSGETGVTLSFFDETGLVLSVTGTIGGEKRGGWAIDDVAGLPAGTFGVRLTADTSVVASLSSFGITTQKSFGMIGAAGGGSVSGVLPITDLSRRTSDSDDLGAPLRPSRASVLSVLNTSGVVASVTFSFVADDDSIEPETRVLTVQTNARATLSIADLALPADFEFAVAYVADAAVTVLVSTGDDIAGGGSGFAQFASSDWDFASGSMNAARAGQGLFESLSIYNPQNQRLEVNVDLLLDDGQVFSLSLQLDSRRATSVPIHVISAFVQRAATQTYAIHLTAAQPLVAAYRRWDDVLNGGFVTLGSPGGNAISLNGMTP